MLFRREIVEKPNPARRLSKNAQSNCNVWKLEFPVVWRIISCSLADKYTPQKHGTQKLLVCRCSSFSKEFFSASMSVFGDANSERRLEGCPVGSFRKLPVGSFWSSGTWSCGVLSTLGSLKWVMLVAKPIMWKKNSLLLLLAALSQLKDLDTE